MTGKKAIAILSGGLDSSVSLLKAKSSYEVMLALTFDYGQRAAPREISAARRLCEREKIPHEVLKLLWLEKLTDTALVNRDQNLPQLKENQLNDPKATGASAKAVWVPNRNGLFINIAGCYADRWGASVILTGFNAEEAVTFPDNSLDFAKVASQSLFYSTQVQARVESLTQTMSKEQIAREALALDLPFELVWSCYEGGDKMCGRCESCLRSKRAYQRAGVWERMKGFFEE